jgi:hypothetical protein
MTTLCGQNSVQSFPLPWESSGVRPPQSLALGGMLPLATVIAHVSAAASVAPDAGSDCGSELPEQPAATTINAAKTMILMPRLFRFIHAWRPTGSSAERVLAS